MATAHSGETRMVFRAIRGRQRRRGAEAEVHLGDLVRDMHFFGGLLGAERATALRLMRLALQRRLAVDAPAVVSAWVQVHGLSAWMHAAVGDTYPTQTRAVTAYPFAALERAATRRLSGGGS